jgi:hypothetical protein
MTPQLPENKIPQFPLCRICSKPLSEGEASLNRTWHFDCEVCTICKCHFPNPQRISECLDTHVPVSHITCFSRAKIEEIKNKVIPITREHVTSLNNQILTMRAMLDPLPADLEILHGTLRDLQECASNVKFILELTKDKIRISDSQEYAEKVRTERKAKSETSASENERKATLQAERENPELRARRKAIEGIMSTFSFTREAAEAMLAKQAAPSGPKVQ